MNNKYSKISYLLVGILLLSFPALFGCSEKKEVKTTQIPTSPPAPIPPVNKPHDGPSDGDGETPGDGHGPGVPAPTDPDQPSPELKIYSRVFCENQVISSGSFSTFRTDANENQMYAQINIYEGENRLDNIFKPQVISSTNQSVDLFFSQKTNHKTRLLRSSVSLQKRQGYSWEFLSYEDYSSSVQQDLSDEKVQYLPHYLSEISQWILVPNPSGKNYGLYDLNTSGIIQSWDIDPKNSSVANFSGNGATVAFYRKLNNTLRVYVASVNEENGFTLPLSPEATTQLSPVITVDGNAYWIERSPKNTLLMGMKLFTNQNSPRLNNKAEAVILKKISREASASLQVTTKMGVDSLYLYENGGLVIVDVDPTLMSVVGQRNSAVPAAYKYLLEKLKNLGQWPFRTVAMPWTNQILLSMDNYGGSLIYNYEKNQWKVAGTPGTSNLCLNPNAAAEIITGDSIR